MKFDELCEGYGIIQQTKRIMYPRQIKLSESFLEALRNEYYRMKIEEDVAQPIKNRPQKFLKAMQFHLSELEEKAPQELEAYKRIMDEGMGKTFGDLKKGDKVNLSQNINEISPVVIINIIKLKSGRIRVNYKDMEGEVGYFSSNPNEKMRQGFFIEDYDAHRDGSKMKYFAAHRDGSKMKYFADTLTGGITDTGNWLDAINKGDLKGVVSPPWRNDQVNPVWNRQSKDEIRRKKSQNRSQRRK